MESRLSQTLKKIRDTKGPFFLARLALRVTFDPTDPTGVDEEKGMKELAEACKELGLDLTTLR